MHTINIPEDNEHHFPSPENLFLCIHTIYASGIGIGGVLIVQNNNGQEYPITYFSNKLTGAKVNNAVTDFEFWQL